MDHGCCWVTAGICPVDQVCCSVTMGICPVDHAFSGEDQAVSGGGQVAPVGAVSVRGAPMAGSRSRLAVSGSKAGAGAVANCCGAMTRAGGISTAGAGGTGGRSRTVAGGVCAIWA
ncbi:hypothetical protein ACQ86D_48795 [Streptomyces galilaeus]